MLQGKVLDDAREPQHAPGWVFVNKLAHTTWGELDRIGDLRTHGPTWVGALSYVASELRDVTGTAERLYSFQRARLVPLELEVLAGRVPLERPFHLVFAVQALMMGPVL